MNYSASDDYHSRLDWFDRKRINKTKIKKRWFRNFYVLYQSEGYFKHNSFVCEFGKSLEHGVDWRDYPGTFYGPFGNEKEAELFGRQLVKTHLDFVFGG